MSEDETTNQSLLGTRQAAVSAASDDDDGHLIHGAAIGNGDVTNHRFYSLKWPKSELRKAAESLENTPLIKNHEYKDVGSVIGSVTNVEFTPGTGLLYEAEINGLTEEERLIAEKVARGQLEVSVTAKHDEISELEEDDDGNLIVTGIEFKELSVVPIGASETADAKPGSNPAMASLSADELAQTFGRDTTTSSSKQDEQTMTDENEDNEQIQELFEEIQELKEQDADNDISIEDTDELERLGQLKQLDDEMSELEEPVAVEQDRLDELEDKAATADEVTNLYAEKLADDSDVPFTQEELSENFGFQKLKEKFEKRFDVDELAETPEPRSGDPTEEELEDDTPETEELEAELQELKEERDAFEKMGWESHVEEKEEEIAELEEEL